MHCKEHQKNPEGYRPLTRVLLKLNLFTDLYTQQSSERLQESLIRELITAKTPL